MKIEPIYEPYIYSIHYDGQDECEFYRLQDQWNDVEYVVDFFTLNKELLKNDVWVKTPEPESAARKLINDANDLIHYFDELNENTAKGLKPDFDSHFHYLDGEFNYIMEYIPMKSYGLDRPSFLRIYAIKLTDNTYLITGGGIKLADKIQNSPDIKDHVIQNIKRVRAYLRENGILDSDDI